MFGILWTGNSSQAANIFIWNPSGASFSPHLITYGATKMHVLIAYIRSLVIISGGGRMIGPLGKPLLLQSFPTNQNTANYLKQNLSSFFRSRPGPRSTHEGIHSPPKTQE